jgi:hypothetical protein
MFCFSVDIWYPFKLRFSVDKLVIEKSVSCISAKKVIFKLLEKAKEAEVNKMDDFFHKKILRSRKQK